jgi:large subunit ribosomal protein L18
MAKTTRNDARLRRHARVRKNVSGSPEKPRLCVYRSLAEIYAQIIDDESGVTIVSSSSIDKEIKPKTKGLKKTEQAALVGKVLAERAIEKKVSLVVFDRGGNKYNGRVKALADAARQAGLKF